jgi:hydrogenase maturation protease
MGRTLIAGFGNALRGDDAFGVDVIHRLTERGVAGPGVDLMEVGTGGIRLAQELLTPCDRLIIVDAMTKGGAPGSLYVLEVDRVESAPAIDMHLAIPSRALAAAQALGVLPATVILIGCEPLHVDELMTELSKPVSQAVDEAVARIEEILHSAASPVSASLGD